VKRDPVVASAVLLVWAAVALFVLYPLGRLLVVTFWNGGPSLDAVRGLVGDWTHRAALVNSLLLAALVGVAGTALGLAFALLAVRANLPRWVGRALDNLLANSLQYSQTGSLVTIELAAGDEVGIIIVLDDGPVVPPELRSWALLMEAQNDAKRRFEARYGRGLGLYCAAQAARIAGARVALGERAGGSMFELSGPLAR